jgi:tetratricopeptide (TPR) repeat protein
VLGEQARMAGRFAEAQDCWERGLADAERCGDPAMIGFFTRGLGVLAAHRGALADARALLERSLDTTVEHAHLQDFDTLLALAYVAHLAGDTEALHRWLERAREQARRTGSRSGLGLALNLEAESARQAGELDEAEGSYRQALDVLTATGSSERHVARINLALVLLQRGRVDEARPELDAALAASRRLGRSLWEQTVRLGLMVCDAGEPAWDAHLAAVRALDTASGFLDPDLASLAELAGDRALSVGHPRRARDAFTLAARWWAALGRDEEAARVREATMRR